MTGTTAVYLFSSNIRPRYEQDVLNVLAAPNGLAYRFRYRREWVADDLLKAWDGLAGRRCIIHFSLQQPNRYHDAVFFPLRVATITRTFREARDILLVEFAIEGSVSLREPEPEVSGEVVDKVDAYRQVVADYRSHIVGLGVPVPYERSASIGPDVTQDQDAPVDATSDEGVLFDRTSRLLAGTASFQRAKFFRVWRLEQRGAAANAAIVDFDSAAGSYRLSSGGSYQLLLLQSQPQETSGPAWFRVSADEAVLKVVGGPRFEIASRYDVAPLALAAVDLPTARARDGVLEISPEDGVQGPAVTLPFRTEPESLKTAVGVIAALAGLILLGLPALADNSLGLLAILLLVGGSILATLVPLWATGRTPWAG